MRNFKLLAVVAGLFSFLIGCSMNDNPVSSSSHDPSTLGSAKVNIQIGRIGQLAKVTSIELAKLYISLSAPGEATILDTADLTGQGGTSFMRTYDNLASLKTWTVSAVCTDVAGTIIHAGSQNFDVEPKHTTPVNLNINSKFTMLKVNLYPIRDSVTRCVLLVDGNKVDDSTFIKQALKGDTVKLSFNYMDTGVTHQVKMNVYGTMWGDDTLLYTGDTSICLKSGVSATYNVKLHWVGPEVPPTGQAAMTMTLGEVGTAVINGYIDPPYQYYKFVINSFMNNTDNNAIITETSFLDTNGNQVINGQGYTYNVLSNSPMANNGGINMLFNGDVGYVAGGYVGLWAVSPERGGTIVPWEWVVDMGKPYLFGSFFLSTWETSYYKVPEHVTIYGSTDATDWAVLADTTFTSVYDNVTIPLTY